MLINHDMDCIYYVVYYLVEILQNNEENKIPAIYHQVNSRFSNFIHMNLFMTI